MKKDIKRTISFALMLFIAIIPFINIFYIKDNILYKDKNFNLLYGYKDLFIDLNNSNSNIIMIIVKVIYVLLSINILLYGFTTLFGNNYIKKKFKLISLIIIILILFIILLLFIISVMKYKYLNFNIDLNLASGYYLFIIPLVGSIYGFLTK